MAGVVHISEAEAARDFSALLRRVRDGEEVVVDCEGGFEAVVKVAQPSKGRKITEILEALREREARQGLAVPDDQFARDVAEAHERYNAPLDSSAWD